MLKRLPGGGGATLVCAKLAASRFSWGCSMGLKQQQSQEQCAESLASLLASVSSLSLYKQLFLLARTFIYLSFLSSRPCCLGKGLVNQNKINN